MNEMLTWFGVWLAGCLFGVIFFGGLWWTVRKVLFSKCPSLWILTSLLLRTSITLIGFYFVSVNNWKRLLICLLGFVMVRIVISRSTKISNSKNILES